MNEKRVENFKKAKEEYKNAEEESKKAIYEVGNCKLNLQKSLKKTQHFQDLSSAKIKYNQKIIELLKSNPDSDELSSKYLSRKQIDILSEVSLHRNPGVFNQEHESFSLAFANYAMENIDNPDELKKIQDFLKQFQKTMDIESKILELRKGDDNEKKILKLQKFPKIQIQSVKTLYDVFKYNESEHQFLHDSKEALHTTKTEEDAIFQNNFKHLQEKLNPKYQKQISSSSLKFIIDTSSEKAKKIKGNNLNELYGDFKKNLPAGFREFSKDIDKDFLKTEYENFFITKKSELENSEDYDEISKLLLFYTRFHSLCSRFFTSKYESENESTGSDLKAFKAIDDRIKMDDFRETIVDKFIKSLDGLKNEEKRKKNYRI